MYSMRSFYNGDRSSNDFCSYMSCGSCSTYSSCITFILVVRCLASWSFTICMCRTKGLLYRLLEIFLCTTPPFLVHCPVNSSHRGFLKLWSVSDTTQQYHRVLFGFPLPATRSGNCLRAESQRNHSSPLLFPFI